MPESFPEPENPGSPVRKSLPDPAMRKEDEELFLRKIFEADPKQGMDILFRTYYTPLCSHAVRFVYSKQVAEDLVSEVFFQFFRTHAYRDISSSYAGYLFRSVRNEAYSYLKREFGKTTLLEGSAESSQAPSREQPDMEVHFNHLFLKVSETVAELPAQCRKVFLMSRFENKKYHEIADELRISPKTVEVHISKALRYLRQTLRNEWLGILLFFLSPLN